MVGTLATSIELKVPADKIWEKITERDSVVPKLMPEVITSIEFVEGDGGPGSIRLMKFGPAVSGFATFSKEKLEVVDEENKAIKYSVVEGELLNLFKVYTVSMSVIKGGDESSCTVNWSVEYEPVAPEVAPPEIAKDGAINAFKALEAYIIGTLQVSG